MLKILLVLISTIPINLFAQQRVILTWDSFTRDKPANAEHQSVLSCGIGYAYKVNPDKGNLVQIQFKVTTAIDTSKSYFNFNLKNKNYKLLNHEQGHADFATIYALRLKEQFSQTKFLKTTYQTQMTQIYSEIYALLTERQEQYDLETNHGLNDLEQERWDLILKKELNLD